MKRKILITILILTAFVKLQAQELESEVYTGFMNDKMSITLYLQPQENECNGEIYYDGMYQYDGVSNWLQLNITENDKMQFVMVEHKFTGVLILQKAKYSLTGIWISPDSKKQYKVELHQAAMPTKEVESFDDTFEELNYENNDC